jgi:hypothetical protein
MNKKDKFYELKYTVKVAPRIKTVSLQLDATDQNLQEKVKNAFALAKSAGQELNLIFNSGALQENRSQASQL